MRRGNKALLMNVSAAADQWLQARGIGSELSRRVLRALALLALASLAAGLLLARWTPQVWCFGLGTAFAGVNVFCLTRTIGAVVSHPTDRGLRRWAGVWLFLRIALTLTAMLVIIHFVPRAYAGLLAGFTAGMAVLALHGLIWRGQTH